MIAKMIVDADLCIKLGSSSKYCFLYEILPLVSGRIYMHTYTHGEVKMPPSAVDQLQKLINEGRVELVNESGLNTQDRVVYDAAYRNLAGVMIDPLLPNKNRGEVCALAYAKATGIPVIATDEKHLQPIIDSQLNTGIDDITCIRIVDIVEKAHNGEIDIPRKLCKVLWVVAGNDKKVFDNRIWPLEQ